MRFTITPAKLAAAVAPLALTAAIMVPTASAAPVNVGPAIANVGVQDIPVLAAPQQQQAGIAPDHPHGGTASGTGHTVG